MADQFCRIVDTTLTETSLGSDAAQSILTTDANTSYIIRDVYKKDSGTETELSMTLALEMDGVDVANSITTSASGSLVVPPNSTLCVKETSSNYPLCYRSVDTAYLHNYCCCDTCVTVSCSVNDIDSGSVAVSSFCNNCYCKFLCADDGQQAFEYNSTCCFSIQIQAQSNCNLYMIHRHDCQCTSCCNLIGTTPVYLNNGAIIIGSAGQSCIWDVDHRVNCCGCSPAAGANFSSYCNYNPCSPSTNAKTSISAPHPCYGRRCRAFAYFAGAACHSTITFVHIDLDVGTPTLMYCRTPSSYGSSCTCNGMMNDFAEMLTFYSKADDEWRLVTTNGSFYEVFDEEGSCLTRHTFPSDYQSGCRTIRFVDEDYLYIPLSYNGQVSRVPLGDFLKGEFGNATCLADGSPTIGDTACGVRAFSVKKSPYQNPIPCCFDVDPSTKLAIYGIKST